MGACYLLDMQPSIEDPFLSDSLWLFFFFHITNNTDTHFGKLRSPGHFGGWVKGQGKSGYIQFFLHRSGLINKFRNKEVGDLCFSLPWNNHLNTDFAAFFFSCYGSLRSNNSSYSKNKPMDKLHL